MSVLAFCNDFFRDCSTPQEYFDYGLYIPGPEKHDPTEPDPETAEESGSAEGEEGSVGGGSGGGGEADVPAEPPKPVVEINKEKEEYGPPKSVAESAAKAHEDGLAPTQAELRALEEKYGNNVSYEQYQEFKKEVRKAMASDTAETLCTFFEHFDTQKTGKLSTQQVKNLLSNFGEPLTDAEADALLKDCGFGGQDEIDYKELIEKMLA